MTCRLQLSILPPGDPVNDHFETVCARLAEDYGWLPAAVLEMDRETLYAVCYHPRNKDGHLEIQPVGAGDGEGGGVKRAGPREACAARLLAFGVWEPEFVAAWFADEQRERRERDRPRDGRDGRDGRERK